ncbi:MAG: CHAT domain-containing protein [Bacteroidota bacterium]
MEPTRAQVPTDENYRAIQLGEDLLQRGKAYVKSSQLDSASICFEAAIGEFDKAQYREGTYGAGILLAEIFETEQRIETLLKHKNVFQSYPDQSDSLGVALNFAIGKAFVAKGELLKAHYKLAYCKSTLEGKDFANPKLTYQLLQALISLYEKLDFPKEVLKLYEKNRDFFREQSRLPLSIPALLQTHLSFSEAYISCFKFEKAAILLLEVEYLLGEKSTTIPPEEERIIQEKYGKLQLSLQNYPAAKKAFDAYEKLSSSQGIVGPLIPYYKGRLAFANRDSAVGEVWLQKAQQRFIEQNQTNASEFHHTQLLLAQLYLESGEAKEAVEILESLLSQQKGLDEDITKDDPQLLLNLPPSKSNYQTLSLLARAKVMRSRESISLDSDLKKASIIAYQQAAQMGDSLRYKFAFLNFALTNRKERSVFYEGGIALALELMEETKDKRYLGIAFQFQQRKKAEDSREEFTRFFREQGVPWNFDHELNRKYLLYKIKEQKERLNLLKGEDRTLLEKLIQQDEDELAELLRSISHKHQAFMEISRSADITDIGSLRDELKPFECMISFFTGESHVYAFELRESGTSFRKFPKNDELIASFIHDIENRSEDVLSFQIKAHEIYQSLFEPHSKDSINSLILVPDGILHYLPFEVLLESQNHKIDEYGQLPYLIHKYPIRYLTHSKEILPDVGTNFYQQAYQILMFFPDIYAADHANSSIVPPGGGNFFKTYQSLPELNQLREKLKNRAQLINALFIEKELATISNFHGYGNLFTCIELDSYAISSDLQASLTHLVLSNKEDQFDSLTIGQICQGNFPADLILLPYHYPVGQIYNGAGLRSLLAAFQYAKTQNMLISLWGNAEPSQQISLSEFYRQLYTGKGKAYSLQQAKVQFLSQPSDYHHPHYWASLVLYGDNTELSGEERPWWTYGALIFALTLLFLIIFGFRRKKRKA